MSTSDENWVRVEDSQGCYFTQKFFINEIPNDLILVASGTAPDCGQSNGMVETEVANADGQINYVWDPPAGNVSAITGVGPGTYTVTVTDAKGCSRTETVALEAEEGVLTLSGTQPKLRWRQQRHGHDSGHPWNSDHSLEQ
ncbi:MAG: hypothetical protein IPK99_12535 [Flavobacteriales bacterium]|nr:hypothetical protein [Flavobacteriales bacterium]